MAPTDSPMDVPSIAFGFTIGFCVLTGMKVARQSIAMYKRTKSILLLYPWLCWTELIVNFIVALTTWLYLHGNIPASFGFFFGTVVLWTFETQFLMHIITNRVALVMVDKRKAVKLKWSVGIIVGLVNISVFCIWIPARMEVSQTFIHVNDIWDRIEKVIYLVLDLALNLYFLYLVRSRLIAKGLNKYKPLWNFNAAIITVSISMDVLIIGMMSLPNTFIYVQFHPLAYIVKLNIECSMADLISKIVRGSQRTDNFHSDSYSHPTELTSHGRSRHTRMEGTQKGAKEDFGNVTISNYKADVRKADPDEVSLDDDEIQHGGIMKTTATTQVVHEVGRVDAERGSTSSSTVQLNDEYRGKK